MKRRPPVIFFVALIFYLLTLAPTVLWGDDAEYQRRAYALELGAGLNDHPLYLAWAHLFTYVPLGDVAWRVNLCSAVGGAAGVALVFALLRRRMGGGPAGAGAGALALSQAYWMHAVRAEVYTTYLALFALSLYAGVRWLESRRPLWLGLAAFALSLSAAIHMLALTALPALAFLFGCAIWRRSLTAEAQRTQRKPEGAGGALALGMGGLIAGLLPLAAFLLLAGPSALAGQLAATARGGLALAPARWPADAAFGAGYLVYQFPLTLPLACVGLRRLWRADRAACCYLALAGLGAAAFAFDFQAPDRYVFYLPSYLTVALFIAGGVEAALERWPARRGLLAGAVVAPLALYLILPLSLNALKLNPFGFRDLPYRDGNLFHLLPAKTAYWGPRHFGERVLDGLPAGALILADATLRQNLLYFQGVEGRRPDVEVVEIYAGAGKQLPFIAEAIGRRRVFVAAVDRYLDRAEIEARYAIEPAGLIYEVKAR